MAMRVVCEDATIEMMTGRLGRRRTLLLLRDAASSNGARRRIGDLIGGKADLRTTGPGERMISVTMTRGGATWTGNTVTIAMALPHTAVTGLVGERLGDVVEGAGCPGRRIDAISASATHTSLTVQSAHVDVMRLPLSIADRMAGPLRRLHHGWREDFATVRRDERREPGLGDLATGAMLLALSIVGLILCGPAMAMQMRPMGIVAMIAGGVIGGAMFLPLAVGMSASLWQNAAWWMEIRRAGDGAVTEGE